MNWERFLDQLAEEGLMLWPDGDNLAFEGPEEALTPARLHILKTYKPDLLHVLRHATKQEPLSYGQQALWFEHQINSDGFAYNVSLSLRIHSLVEPATLEYVFQLLVNRHSTLRTTFPLNNGQPVQQVHRYQQVSLQQINAAEWREQELKENVMATHEQPFDLVEGPLFRLSLFTQQANEHVLLFTLHHLVCDGWSIWLMLDELRDLFAAILLDEPVLLPPLQTTYGQYVVGQTRWLQENEEKLWGYWQNTLAGELPLLDLPTDYARPAVRRYQGASQPLLIPNPLMCELIGLAQREGATLYMVLLAAFNVLLHRYTGQDDILVGSPIAGRNRPELASIVGYFTNPVVMRSRLGQNLSFRDLLAEVRQTVLGGFEHQEYPFPLLVQRLQPPRVAGVSAIFQTLFVLQKAQTDTQIMELMRATRTEPQYFGGLYLSPFPLPQSQGQFDLSLELFHTATELSGALNYNPELFAPATTRRMAGHFQTLLEGIVRNPDQSIAQLPLLSERERYQLLVEWNATPPDSSPATSQFVHQLFEEQAARTPEAIAVILPSEQGGVAQQLTYRELNAKANQLAHYLIAQGVGPDMLVALCVPRSIEMVIGLLGILKAGGAYVPLDPTYPEERLAFILKDAQPAVLVTQAAIEANLPAHTVPVVCLARDWELISQANPTSPISHTEPDQIAYVIYTSGSTGEPKGVLISHRSLLNHSYAIMAEYELTAQDRVLQFASISFDVAAEELFPSWLSGATVLLRPGNIAHSFAELAKFVDRHRLTLLNLPASYWHEWVLALSEGNSYVPSSLRLLVVGSEKVEHERLMRWQQLVDRQIGWRNAYGPTEATITATLYNPAQREDESDKSTHVVPIGRPIANTELYILDEALQPVPIGVPGELHIGGLGLALGYLNRPELTKAKFIEHPFSHEAGARLYKTGDLCRYLPDGNIEFLGRTDDQVKIRGFRIELGEIEAALNSQANVREAVVVMRSETSGKRLVAYIVTASSKMVEDGVVPIGHDITASSKMIEDDGIVNKHQRYEKLKQLRANLAQRLPDYMIPAQFVRLEALPLTPNGKIDRRALPEPEVYELDSVQRVLPRTPTEEILLAIWQEVLGVRVGIHDNFFEIGGHSLLATQVVSRIRQSLQVELPLRRLFSAPTIAELAKQLHSSEQVLPPLTPLDDVERMGTLPLSFAQQRLWFLAQLESTSEAYNAPAALRLDGALDLHAFCASWQAICERHEILRTTFPAVDGKARQQIHAPSVTLSALRQAQGTAGLGYQLEMIDLSGWPLDDQEAEVMRLAEQESTRPFDLINGPLWRVSLLRLAEESHVLLVTMHHIISDGWSVGVLVRELSALYGQKRTAGKRTTEAVTTGQKRTGEKRTTEVVTTGVTPLSVQYADFAVWQRSWLRGELLEAHLAYWKAQLADAPSLLSLPTDYVRPALQRNRGDRIAFALSEGLSKKLTRLSQTYSATLFMTLQAAFAVLLSRYTSQEDILIGTPIANRQVAEVENLIGFFVNTLVLRNDLSGNPTFADFLARVRQTALDAYQHQALPFELLVETVQPERSLAHSPLFQVMFILQNNRQETLSFSDITIRPIDVDYPIAKFDLTLAIEPHGERLTAWWEYNTDLFERATIERMAGHFQVLLEGIVANPNQPIAHLPLLSEQERYKLLVEWNDLGLPADCTGMPARSTADNGSCHLGIHQLFEQQVARTPEAIAVIYPSTIGETTQQLTYRELDVRANQLAHRLMAQGVGPNVLVGLCVERSLEMVVGLLGILKAGGAYVPLDPAYPQGRLAFILKDAQPAVLVTQAAIEATLPAHTVPVVCLDRDWDVIRLASATSPISRTQPDQIAYVIYTSGSTGEPKGVLISHRSLRNHSDAMMAEYELTAQDRVLQFASISFDVAAEELFPSWLSGATVILRPGQMAFSFAELAKFVDHHRLTLLNLPASYWHEWVLALSEGSSYVPASLRLLVVGSEKVEHERLRRWQQLVDRQIGWRNAYGPTEATITATLYNPAQREDESTHVVPIGRPIANTELYILDQARQPVPIGVPGELHIGGLGLALGYLNRPELTKAKFIEHPFSDEAGARLYKTGDLCRYRPNGDIEFIGRLDHQVKIHGFRIELGEIESCLMQMESISEAVVCPEPNNPSSLRAYLVLNNALTGSGRRYQVHTSLSKPPLQREMEQVHLHVWPRFFMGDAVNVRYWPHLYDTFPAYQSAIIDAGEVVAACNAIPLYWDGQQESLPTGWDDAVLRGFEGHQKGVLPNTLCILVGSIRQSHQGQGLSYELIKIMKSLAYTIEGIQYVIAPVRPTHKRRYPDMTLEQYCEQKREDGLSLDPWVRVHQRLGGTILAFSHHSQLVEGTISQWELWTEQTISQSGEYLFEGCMQPVTIDIEQDSGRYDDLAVWMRHTPEPYLSFNPADVTPKALRAKLAQSLPDYMIPAAFVLLDAMPLTPNGKIDRRALLALERAESDLFSSTAFMAPRSQTEQQLVYIWQELLDVYASRVGIRDNFFDLGGHSLLAVRLMAQIQQHFGVHLPLATLFERPTIEQLAIRLADRQAKADWSVLVPIQPNGEQLPFFCLPGEGGNVIGLYDLARLMGAEQPFYGLQAVGLDGESAPYSSIEAMAAHHINAIQTIQPQGPYLLGGYSFGGLVAFEMAQQLLKAGDEVANVILFDTFAPSEERRLALDEGSGDDAKWLLLYAETAGQMVGQKSRLSYEHLLTLDAEAQLLSFKEELERLNLWPTGSDLKLLRGLLRVLKTNSQIRYVPQSEIPTPITLFSAQERSTEQAERQKEQPYDPSYGWQPFAKGPVNVISVPGNHTTMMVQPHSEALAKQLREVLHKAYSYK